MIKIAKSSADMRNCTLKYSRRIPDFSLGNPDSYLDSIYFRNGEKYLDDRLKTPVKALLDMTGVSSAVGNVSKLVPTVHLGINMGPKEIPGHSEEMKRFASMNESKEALLTAIAIGHDSILHFVDNYSH
jgi:hypothetical protein